MPTRTSSIDIVFPASTGGEWTVTVTADSVSCSCPAWRFQNKPATERVCKHTNRVVRHTVELPQAV